jgi:hypothetical protein
MQILSLETVQFNDIVEQGLYIDEEHKWLPIGQSLKFALAGNPVVIENTRSGRPITIIAQEDRGWITKTTLLALKALASTPNVNFSFTFIDDSNQTIVRTVRFKRDPYPLDLQPIDAAHNFYTGSIHLIEV